MADEEFLKVTEQNPGVHTSHPLRNKKNHDKLLAYCKARIEYAVEAQAPMRERYEMIDRELAGFLKLDPEDRKRKRENLRGEGIKPTKMKPQLVLTHLARGVTYLVSVFSPDTGLYEALATKNEQKIANAFTELMNQHAIKGSYFRQQCLYFLNSLKYNLAGMHAQWDTVTGNVLKDSGGGTTELASTVLWAGNSIRAVDMYNTFWDPAVHPIDVPKQAEFAGEVRMVTPFKLKWMIDKGEIFNTKELLKNQRSEFMWFKDIPQVRIDNYSSEHRPDGKHNWSWILTAGRSKGNEQGGFELVDLYIRLIPSEFGLVQSKDKRNRIEIWRITIGNGNHIVATEYMNNVHDYLPYCFGSPNEDNLGLQSKGPGENLMPFQDFGAFLLNAHVEASRKNIWDLYVYDPTAINLKEIGDDVAGRVPLLPGGYGKDVRSIIWHAETKLDTKESLNQFQTVLDLMEYMFPTRQLQQVADIQRATQNQVAATIQGSQREAWKMARLLDEQCMSPLRFIMHANIMQYQEQMTIIGQDGTEIQINPTEFRKAKLEFKIGEGLKAIDQMVVQGNTKEILGMMLQSQQANQEMDMLGLINHLSSILGVKADLTQFRRPIQQTAAQSVAENAGAVVQEQIAADAAAQSAGPLAAQ